MYECGTFAPMERKIIFTKEAPAAIGPYSQAVMFGNHLYTSGQIAIDPVTNELFKGDIQQETTLVMHNLKAILHAAGMGFENVLKATIFLSDMGQFALVNEVYGSFFSEAPPARETVQVSVLPKGVNVEISMIAAK